MKILVSDATPHNRQNLAAYLTQSGLNVIATAATGAETFKLVEAFTPDIIILDINLPDVEIFEFIAELQKANQASMVILLMISFDPAVEQRGLQAGAYTCLAKNDGIDPLIHAIQQIQLNFNQGA